MLESLHIENIAVIKSVDIDFSRGLCVLTGELAGMLAHEAVGHTVESDLVMAGSVAASLLGKYRRNSNGKFAGRKSQKRPI